MTGFTATSTIRRAWLLASTALLVALAALWTERAPAQEGPADPLTAEELEALVGPIALYPDEVLAVVLPAATYPLQVVQAARFLEDRADNPALEPDPEWDDSVVALLNYPDVLRLMDGDLDWTWDLGEAVLDDQAAVLAAVQIFRDRAYDAGNLVSDDRQTVTESSGVIAIEPADPEVVYIPYYEPTAVIVRQPRPVFHYYPYAYPLYYYPYPIGYSFSTGYFWGVTSAFAIGWDTHFIHVHHHTHFRHPYYRRTFYTPYYTRRGINVTVNINNYRNVWQPRRIRGARPYDGVRAFRGDDRVRRTYDGRRYRYAEGYVDGDRSRQRTLSGEGPARGTATLPRQGGQRSATTGNSRFGGVAPGTTRRGSETIRPSGTRERTEAARRTDSGDRGVLRPGTREGAARSEVTRPGTLGGVSTERRTAPRAPGDRGTQAPVYRATPERGVTNRSGIATGSGARQRAATNDPGRGMQQRTVPPQNRSQTRSIAPPSRNETRSLTPRAQTRAAPPVAARSQIRSAPPAAARSQVRSSPPAAAPRSQVRSSPPARVTQPRATSSGSRFGGVAPSSRAPRATAPRATAPRAAAPRASGARMQGGARSQLGGSRQSRQR